MSNNPWASGKDAHAFCDRCGFRIKYRELKEITLKDNKTNLMVCPPCWEISHPQLMQGQYPIVDPQALRHPRVDTSYVTSGLLVNNQLGEGSRNIGWGWNPVGGSSFFDAALTPNALVTRASVGTVTISTT